MSFLMLLICLLTMYVSYVLMTKKASKEFEKNATPFLKFSIRLFYVLVFFSGLLGVITSIINMGL